MHHLISVYILETFSTISQVIQHFKFRMVRFDLALAGSLLLPSVSLIHSMNIVVNVFMCFS